MGFTNSKIDVFLYTLYQDKVHTIILIYVDDIIITGFDTKAIDQLIYQMSIVFLVKDLRPLSFFLGVETLCQSHDIFLTQLKYIADLLQKVNIYKVKPCLASISTTSHFPKF
jgi:hypothetical protein